MKQHQPLTKLEQHLISRLEEATQTMKQADQELQDLRQVNATLKSKLTDSVRLPEGFKISQATQHALSTSKAQLATAQKLLQEEIDHFTKQQLQEIHDRNTEALKKSQYAKALNSSYAVATKAINERKANIQANGVSFTVGLSGYTAKGEFDPQSNRLFTFEALGPFDLIEIKNQEYTILTSDISKINAGNEYHLLPKRHSNR